MEKVYLGNYGNTQVEQPANLQCRMGSLAGNAVYKRDKRAKLQENKSPGQKRGERNSRALDISISLSINVYTHTYIFIFDVFMQLGV